MKHFNLLLNLSFLFCLFFHGAIAQWENTNGPPGGNITALAVNGSFLFAGTNSDGVYVSTNDGVSWLKTMSESNPKFVTSLMIRDSLLFAGTLGSGVFLSTNNGMNWNAINTGITQNVVKALATKDSFIFAGTDGEGVFISSNNGASWMESNTGLTNKIIFSLAVIGDTVYTGTGNGVFFSSDNGTTWTHIYSVTNVNSIAIHRDNLFVSAYNVFIFWNPSPNWEFLHQILLETFVYTLFTKDTLLFVGTHNGVFRVTDYDIWTEANFGLTGSAVTSFVAKDTILFAGTKGGGIFKSSDNGTTWTSSNEGLSSPIVTSLVADSVNLFVGSYGGGIFLSTDHGMSWSINNTGITNTDIFSLAQKDSLLVAGTDFGEIFLSTNYGVQWTPIDSGLPIGSVMSLFFNDAYIYTSISNSGVYRSNDFGTIWTSINELVNQDVSSFAANNGNIFVGTEGAGVFRSTDNGTNWNSTNTGLTNLMVSGLAIVGTNIVAGTNGGIFISTDYGENWTAKNSGIIHRDIESIAISDTNIYITTSDGVYFSFDRGNSWKLINSGLPNKQIVSLSVSDTKLFCGYEEVEGVWRRSLSEIVPSQHEIDVLNRWNLVSIPINMEDTNKNIIFPSSVSSAFAFLGTYVEKSFLHPGLAYWIKFDLSETISLRGFPISVDSIDVSEGWNLIGSISQNVSITDVYSIPSSIVTSNFYGYNEGYIISDSIKPGKGYWVKASQAGKLILSTSTNSSTNRIRIIPTTELPPSPPSEINSEENTLPQLYILEQNYPNPFNPSTKIKYQLPVDGLVSIKIFNLLGQEILTLENQIQKAGYKSVDFNAEKLESGMYFYRITAQGVDGTSFSDVKKMLLLR